MESSHDYDHSVLISSIKKFENQFNVKFLVEESKDYIILWKFKDCIKSWMLAVYQENNYILLMHKEENSPTYLPLSTTTTTLSSQCKLLMQMVQICSTSTLLLWRLEAKRPYLILMGCLIASRKHYFAVWESDWVGGTCHGRTQMQWSPIGNWTISSSSSLSWCCRGRVCKDIHHREHM